MAEIELGQRIADLRVSLQAAIKRRALMFGLGAINHALTAQPATGDDVSTSGSVNVRPLQTKTMGDDMRQNSELTCS